MSTHFSHPARLVVSSVGVAMLMVALTAATPRAHAQRALTLDEALRLAQERSHGMGTLQP